MSGFVRATRQRAYIKLAITGPSGSGKTYGALRVAFGLGGRVAMIDTENGSGSLYADLGAYDVLEIAAPFTVAKYTAAINDAAAAGYDVLIIDSLTHAWAGEGGLLARKEALDARGGNSFTNWASITKEHETFKAAILQAPIHVVATMRSKQEYVIQQDGNQKATPKKVGMAPVQREGLEYEFTVVFDVAIDHNAATSKDRTGLFDGMIERLTEEHGRRISAWLAGGAEPTPRPAAAPEPVEAPVPATNGGGRVSTADRVQQHMQAAGQHHPIANPAPALNPLAARRQAWDKLVATEGFLPDPNDKPACRKWIGELLGKQIIKLSELTVEDLEEAVTVQINRVEQRKAADDIDDVIWSDDDDFPVEHEPATEPITVA